MIQMPAEGHKEAQPLIMLNKVVKPHSELAAGEREGEKKRERGREKGREKGRGREERGREGRREGEWERKRGRRKERERREGEIAGEG